MKYAGYLLIGFVVFWLVMFLSTSIAYMIGAGPGEIGVVVAAVSMLCAIVVICTWILVDTIKNNQMQK